MSQFPDEFDSQQLDVNPQKQADSSNKNTVEGNKNSTVQGNDNQAVLGSNNNVFYGSNNQIQFVSSNAQNLPPQKPKREIPPLLPCLVNRSQQEYQLEMGIKKLIKKTPQSPLICIIHGDECQSHDRFLNRLYKVSLPKFLEEELIIKYHLPSPPKLNNYRELSDYLHNQLAQIIVNRSSAHLEEIKDCFNDSPQPILIHTHLSSEQLQKQELETLNNFLNFWHTWPVEVNQKLIICIFIKYKGQIKSTKNSDKIRSFFHWIKYFLQRYRYQKIKKKIYQYIESLSQSNFDKFTCLSGLVLPELTVVHQWEVEEWVRMEDTQKVIGEAMADKFIKEIRELFDKYSSDIIPMDDLADDLIKLLKSNLSGEGEMT